MTVVDLPQFTSTAFITLSPRVIDPITMSTGWAANRPGADQPDENKGPTLSAVSVTLPVIALLIVSLRVWCRVRLLKSFGADVSASRYPF